MPPTLLTGWHGATAEPAPRRQLGIDVAAVFARAMAGTGWKCTPVDYAAEVNRLVDAHTAGLTAHIADLQAELDSATRLVGLLQTRHDEALAVWAEVGT